MKLETRNAKLHRSLREAFSLLELIVVLAVIGMLAFLAVPYIARSKAKADRISCVGHLKNIGLAFRIFATDNNGLFPPRLIATNGVELTSLKPIEIFRVLSNELSTPVIIHCPADKKRKRAYDFATLKPENISYFINLNADETQPQMVLSGDRNLQTNGVPVQPGLLTLTSNTLLGWTKELHVQNGSVTMGDGSVQQMRSYRFESETNNYLVVP
jgi:prepilin-type N-terminal cleavage/methylation domain-containing protein